MAGRGISPSLSFVERHLRGLRLSPASELSIVLEDLKFVERTWMWIDAALSDAERRQIGDKSVKLWMRELRDLMYDADDLFDSYQYHLLAKKVERELAKEKVEQQKKGSNQVDDADDAEEVRVPNPNSSASSMPPDSSGSVDAKFLCEIAEGVRKFRQRFDEIAKRKDALHLGDLQVIGSWGFDNRRASKREAVSTPADRKMFGRDKQLSELVELLVKQPDGDDDEDGIGVVPSVVGVIGMGGVGKTTLAQHAYNHPDVSRYFDVKGWLCVSDDFDVVALTKAALVLLTDNTYPGLEQFDKLQAYLKDAVTGQKFLLVMDDVWNEDFDVWEAFTAPLRYGGARGSKILITTRNQPVVDATLEAKSLNLQQLSDEDGWLLFERYALHNRSTEYVELVEIGKEIVRKCEGLPLAIKVLASLVRQRTRTDGFDEEKKRWRRLLKSDLWDIESTEGGTHILGPLLVSYLHLPAHLKRCFGLCSIFPKGHSIEIVDLIRLWAAHGLIQAETERELKNRGMKYIDDLFSRSFLQTCDGFNCIGMHDLLHDLAQHISGAECHNIVGYILYNQNLDTNVRHLLIKGSGNIVNIIHSLSHQKTSGLRTLWITHKRPLSLMPSSPALEDPVMNELVPKRSKLQLMNIPALSAAEKSKLPLMKTPDYCYFQCLRILDLSNENVNELALDSFKSMKLLSDLNLRGTEIKELPESIYKLYNLQRLNLNSSCITLLSSSIGNLKNLCYLDLSFTNIKKLPEGICMLCNLQHMYLVKLQIKELPSSIGRLFNLRILNLSDNRLIKELPESIGNLRNLQVLNMSRCTLLQKFPSSIVNLTKLRVFDIYGCCKVYYLPAGIDRLTKLKHLSRFPVGNIRSGHAGIAEMKDLLHLKDEEFAITGLCNAVNETDDTLGILINKMRIKILELDWEISYREEAGGGGGGGGGEEGIANDEAVMQRLEPHPNLEELTVKRYGGSQVSPWLGDPLFTRLTRVELQGFRKRSSLSPLGLLPSLEKLIIQGMPLPREVVSQQGHFPKLEKLLLVDCPTLVSFPLYKLSAIKFLYTIRCKNFQSIEFEEPFAKGRPTNGSSLIELNIWVCPQLYLPPETLPLPLRVLTVDDHQIHPPSMHEVVSVYKFLDAK